MIAFFSVKARCAALALGLVSLVYAGSAGADTSSGYGNPVSYSQPSAWTVMPPMLPSFGYATPGQYRPTYTPPSHKPQPIVRKSFPTPKRPHPFHGHYARPQKTIKHHGDVGSRVVYVPVPKYQEKVVTVAQPKTVKKTVRVNRYMVEKVHGDRCIKNGPGQVYLQPSHLSEVLGDVIEGEKVKVTFCLTDDAMNRQWCALKNRKGIEAWLPAKHLALCDW